MNVSQRIQHSKWRILRSPMPNEYPVWHTRYIVDVDTESRNDGNWLNLGLVDCNITNDVMQIKRLKNYRVCKFYWWVESVWLLLHKFWSNFGIFGVKYHNEQSHFFRLPSTWSWHVYTIERDTHDGSGSLFVTENFWGRHDSLCNLSGVIWTILA